MTEMLVNHEKLNDFCRAVLAQSLPGDEAKMVADNLIDAELLGVRSHGVSRLPDYLKRMEDGLVERQTKLTQTNETATTILYNAANGWGQVAGTQAMNDAIEKALDYGTGFAGVSDSNHFGTASYYARIAAKRGCIGIVMTNASAMMVPFGSKEPSLGTNPISIAVPTGEGKEPVLLDMATSNVARGKILLAKKKGQSIPEGWAITKDGKQTTDPIEALEGFVLPLGPKGSGLAIMVDILSGVLTGALFGKKIPRMYEDNEPQLIGHFFGAISVEAFMDASLFYQRIQEKVDETVNSAPAEGFDRVYMPGEIELDRKKQQENQGITLSEEIYKELTQAGVQYGVDINQYFSTQNKEAAQSNG